MNYIILQMLNIISKYKNCNLQFEYDSNNVILKKYFKILNES